jgi:hypothetical protein
MAVNVAFPGHKQCSRREKQLVKQDRKWKKKLETATVHVEGQHIIRRERETSLRQEKRKNESKLAQKVKNSLPFLRPVHGSGPGRPTAAQKNQAAAVKTRVPPYRRFGPPEGICLFSGRINKREEQHLAIASH